MSANDATKAPDSEACAAVLKAILATLEAQTAAMQASAASLALIAEALDNCAGLPVAIVSQP